DAIRADVLDRTRAYGPGDQRQVLETRQTLRERPVHEGVPVLAGCGFDEYASAVLVDNPLAPQRNLQNRALEVARQQQVAAAAQHQDTRLARQGGQRLVELGGLVEHDQPARTRLDTEAVQRLQRGGFLDQQ